MDVIIPFYTTATVYKLVESPEGLLIRREELIEVLDTILDNDETEHDNFVKLLKYLKGVES